MKSCNTDRGAPPTLLKPLLKPLLLILLLRTAAAEIEHGKAAAERVVNGNYWSPACPAEFHKAWSAQNVASVCFYVSSVKLDWHAARTACHNLAAYRSRCHGDLASVLNTGESDFVRSLMSQLQVNDHAWIGYNDLSWENSFRWTDGRQGYWTNFYPGEPNNGGAYGSEHCVELMNALNGQWNDRDCSHQKYYVCKAYCV
ncbi:perlucin-like [Pollicipes pollicipes]|uniref:perlucin-like n=1 Tax=Pollicipes pollicipes TaxID=41117 RepID=UPI001884B952|nr:perlucin-like [Pollicipes pollicipes]